MKNLTNKIKKIKGIVLGINIEEQQIKKAIYQNEKIYKCDLLESVKKETKNTQEKENHQKTVQIKKLKKVYHENKVDYLLCNINNIEKYIPYIWKDAFSITKKEICFYGILEKEEKQNFLEKCQRYKGEINRQQEGKYTFFYIQSNKVPWYKSYFYFGIDEINLFLDKITEFLEK